MGHPRAGRKTDPEVICYILMQSVLWWEKEAQEPNLVGVEWEGDFRERVSWELSLWA